MEKVAITFFLAMISHVLLGQGKPEWLNDNTRRMNYPSDVYYTGYASGVIPAGKSLQEFTQQITTEAQADLSRKIRVQITSTNVNETSAVTSGGRYSENESFTTRSAAESSVELVGLKTESYHDQASRTVHAFTYVKREDLASYYRNIINQELTNAETAFGVAEQMAGSGKKMSAREKAEEARAILKREVIANSREQLVLINAGTESTLQNERERAILHKVENMLINLRQLATVFVECRHENRGNAKDDAFSNDPGILFGIVVQKLSENDCTITDNREEADFVLTLITSTTQRSAGTAQIPMMSYYANVRGSLFNRMTDRKTVDFTIFNDSSSYSSGRSPEEAATRAFNRPELTNLVLEKILPKIKE